MAKQTFKVGEAPWEKSESNGKKMSFPVGAAPWETSESEKRSGEGILSPFVSQLAKAASLGYDPELFAGTQQIIEDVGSVFRGEPAKDIYELEKKKYQERSDRLSQESPIQSMAGLLTGFALPGKAASGAMSKLIPGEGFLPGAARMGAEGGLIAGAYRPEGEDLMAPEKRLESAKYGVAGGALAAGAGKVLQKGGEALEDLAKSQRIKGIGGMWSNIKHLFEKDEARALDKYIKEKNLVSPGSTVESAKKKADTILKNTGEKLKQVYSRVKEKMSDPKLLDRLTPEQEIKYLEAGFFPSSQKKEILQRVSDKMGDKVKSSSGIKAAEDYLDQVISKYGDDIDIIKARELKSELDQAINWKAKDAETSAIQKGLREVRRYISDKIDEQTRFIDEVVGGRDAALLKKLNHEYGMAKTVSDISQNKIGRESMNRLMGLSEQLMGPVAGLGYGVYREGATPEALLYPLAGAALSRGIKRYGPGIGAASASAGSRGLLGAGTVLRGSGASAGGAAGLLAE